MKSTIVEYQDKIRKEKEEQEVLLSHIQYYMTQIKKLDGESSITESESSTK